MMGQSRENLTERTCGQPKKTITLRATNHSGSQSYQTVFLCKERIFPFFATKLGQCTAHTFFSSTTNSQAQQRKSENRKNESLVGSTPVYGII